jgi:copper chaperone
MIEFTVKDMSCDHCVATITKAVKQVDAGGRCEVDLAGKRVRIESARPAEAFRAAIEDAGFTPEAAAR